MLPTLARDFYLPPQPRHGTSMMLSIFCSVLLCFMSLCKGSRLDWLGWPGLPACWCMHCGQGDIKATGQPSAGPRGIISQPQNTQTPHLQINRKASCSTHAGIACSTALSSQFCSHIQRIIKTNSSRWGWQLLLSKILWPFMRLIPRSEQKLDFSWQNQRI